MGLFKNLFKKRVKIEDLQEVTMEYRCPQCGKYTEITTYLEYKQLYDCAHCGRTMVVCHGKTIGYK